MSRLVRMISRASQEGGNQAGPATMTEECVRSLHVSEGIQIANADVSTARGARARTAKRKRCVLNAGDYTN
jgi:hypothetical protein